MKKLIGFSTLAKNLTTDSLLNMISWLCSFEPHALRPSVAPHLVLEWPSVCHRLAAAGLSGLQSSASVRLPHEKTEHHIVGLCLLAPGVPYSGSLTNWSEVCFAQHCLLGKAMDAYSLEVRRCWWFKRPVQVFSRLVGHSEAQVDMRPQSMVFFPAALQKLLLQELTSTDSNARQTARHICQHFQIQPHMAAAIQVAAPLIDEMRATHLDELVLRASWIHPLQGFPPAWLGKLSCQEEDDSHPKRLDWERLQEAVNLVRCCALQQGLANPVCKKSVVDTLKFLEEVLLFPATTDTLALFVCCFCKML